MMKGILFSQTNFLNYKYESSNLLSKIILFNYQAKNDNRRTTYLITDNEMNF